MPNLDGFDLARMIKARPELGTPTIMMLSSVGHRASTQHLRDIGIASYLTKPVRRPVLIDSMLSVLARSAERRVVPRTAKLTSVRESLRVLVAEDNDVNARLVTALLEKRGHSVLRAETGKQAVDAVAEGGIDLVLMDVQMPEMDGLDATGAIRRSESVSGGHIPIIALTAHAMTGDREACLEAGADEYLAKPINGKKLFALIDTLMGASVEASSTAMRAGSTEAVIALDELMERVDGDRELLIDIARTFNDEVPALLANVRQSASARDARGLERAAHALKGACSNFSAAAAVDAMSVLEQAGRSQKFEQIDECLDRAERELERLRRALVALCDSRQESAA